MRDSGDVCGARNTQFDQEFFGLFRGEMVFAYDWRDRIGDFCVADYLVEHYTVHVVITGRACNLLNEAGMIK